MPPFHHFWYGQAAMSSGAGVMADWQLVFGSALGLVTRFLKPAAVPARSHPCTAHPPCECRHTLRQTGAGLVAVCTCGPGQCAPFTVQPKDVLIHRLDLPALGEAFRSALDLAPPNPPAHSTSWSHELGVYSSAGARVYFTLASGELFRRELDKLWALRDGPFLLLTPTGAIVNAEVEAALRRQQCAHLDLSSLLHPHRSGRFTATASAEARLGTSLKSITRARAADPALARIDRSLAALRKNLAGSSPPQEPPDESVARQAFALVKALDSRQPARKAPVYTVFRLYCVDGLTVRQIAKHCCCARSLVFTRLNWLRKKLGRNPAELRPCSAQFESIEDSLSDPRARRICRKGSLYGDADPDEPDE
jgi:hypothetical protein